MKRFGTLAAAGMLAFAAAGCGSSSGSGDSGSGDSGSGGSGGGEVQVAATMSVLADMTEQVGGERVEVSTIAPVGATVETFQPSPSDAQKISEADLVVENGTGLESWLDDLIESAGGETPVATLSEDLEPVEGGHESHSEEEHSEEGYSEDGHAHAGGNPHFWLDVENAERDRLQAEWEAEHGQ